jgi:hypothetical protein
MVVGGVGLCFGGEGMGLLGTARSFEVKYHFS